MLMALLHSKLSTQQENMEDILTSNIIGLLKYLPPEEGMLPFLAYAVMPDGQRPFADYVLEGTKIQYEFWPRHEETGCNRCEPDVELRITWPSGKKAIVFIEAKYFSGKSSEENDDVEETRPLPPVDQLAREWHNLINVAEYQKAEPFLVYLTADVGFPRQAIEHSRRAFMEKCSKSKVPFNCAWLSWRHLYAVTRAASDCETRSDLKRLLDRLGFFFYSGISVFKFIDPIDWHFKSPRKLNEQNQRSNEACGTTDYDYSFRAFTKIEWRFKR